MGSGTNATETRTRALLNRARTNLISRTARVYSRLGRSLFKGLNGVVQDWISDVLRAAGAGVASGLLTDLPAMPDDFERVVRETMVRALAQGYWLQHLYMQECRAAVHGHKYRGRVTLADDTDLDDEQIRKLLELLIGSAKVEVDPAWHNVIPADAVKWIEDYTPKLAGVLEGDVLEKVRQTVRDSMYTGATLKQRMEALQEADRKIRDLGKHRAEMIARTEVTRADSMGRLIDMKSNPDVLGVEFSAVLDDRTTDICQSRHGLVMRMDDPRLPYNTPPMHVNCRSLLLSATVYEHPDGLLTSHEFDDMEPGIQRPEDIEAVQMVLESGEGVKQRVPTPNTPPRSTPALVDKTPAVTVSPSPRFLKELRAHQAANRGLGGEPLTESQLLELEDALKKLLSRESVRVAHRTGIDPLKGILKDGYFKTQFETRTSGGLMNRKTRASIEKKLMNYDVKLPVAARPLYGFLVDAVTPDAFNPDVWDTARYGEAAILLKNTVKPWTTFTAGDSLATIRRREKIAPSSLFAPSRDSLLAQKWIPAWHRLQRGELNTVQDLVELRLVDNYVEAQIHERCVRLEDIEVIVFDVGWKPWELPLAWLMELGIPWRQ